MVACSKRHEIEFIGGWIESDPVHPNAAQCMIRGPEYTAAAINATSELGSAIVEAKGGAVYRCAIESSVGSLHGSVRSIDGSSLPK